MRKVKEIIKNAFEIPIICASISIIMFSSVSSGVIAQSNIVNDGIIDTIAQGFLFTEGPLWHPDGYLLFSDINGDKVYKWEESTGVSVYLEPSGKSNGLALDQHGNLLLAQHEKRQVAKIDSTETEIALATHYNGLRLNSPNDIAIHSSGNIYFTDPPYGINPVDEELGFYGIYFVTPDGSQLTMLIDSLQKPNGIVLSNDESKIYISDTDQKRVYVYNVESDGTLSGGAIFAQYTGGLSFGDGMTIDNEGNLFVAGTEGLIYVFSSDGNLLNTIEIPEKTTNLCWGDTNQKVLFVTSGTSVYRINSRLSAKLPDTGQDSDFTSTFGEDSDYEINSMSFTDNGDGTIMDNVTGLMWQQNEGGEMSYEQACVYCDSLELAGFNDWQLPGSQALYSIVDFSREQPPLNLSYFPVSVAEYWWSLTVDYSDSNRIWIVNAGGGIGPHLKNESLSAGGNKHIDVRCVRYLSTTYNPVDLTDNMDSTVTDNNTGLIWQQIEENYTMTWEEALIYAESLNLAGHNDWRLPNIKELRSISNDNFSAPSVNQQFFPVQKSSPYWSSTSISNHPEKAWHTDFNWGLVSYDNKTNNSGYIRCVRGGIDTLTGIGHNYDLKMNYDFRIYPNPSGETVTLNYSLMDESSVSIGLYSIDGQLIRQLYRSYENEGKYSIQFNTTGLSKGIYLIEFKIDGFVKVLKCIKSDKK